MFCLSLEKIVLDSNLKNFGNSRPQILKVFLTEGPNNFEIKIPFLYRLTVFAIAKSLGLITAIIQDAGRTQIEAGNKTFKEAIYFQKNIFSF